MLNSIFFSKNLINLLLWHFKNWELSKNKCIILLINFLGGTETLTTVIYKLRTLEQIYQTHYLIKHNRIC